MKFHFENFSDFVTACEREPVTEYRMTRAQGRRDWTGVDSFSEAVKLAREGWPEGLAQIERHKANFSALIGDRIRKAELTHDVHGFMPDVGAFCAGEPENMFSRTTIERKGPGRIVRLVVQGGASAAISAETITIRGAMICALIDALESAGYSVELTLASPSAVDGEICWVSVLLKTAGAPLELDRVGFALAHPATYRRLVFSLYEQDATFIRRAGNSYGSAIDMPISERGDLYFPRSYTGDIPASAMLPWFKDQLAALGIEFSE